MPINQLDLFAQAAEVETEDPNALPEGWEWVKLGDVASYLNGRAFKPAEWQTEGLPIIRIQNLNDPEAAFNYSDLQFGERFAVRHGDLLFAWSASLGAYIWRGGDAWLNQHIFKVVPEPGVDKTYLFYGLSSVVDALYAKAHGSGMVHVTKKKFEETLIPLPPLSEQTRLVGRIEELFSEIDAGVREAEAALDKLKTYRQAVLHHYLSNEAWERLKLSQVTLFITDGDHQAPPKAEAGVPFIVISNIKHNHPDLTATKFVPREYYEALKENRKPKAGDLLYTVTGSYGIPAFVDGEQEFCFQRHIALLRPNEAVARSFLFYCLLSRQVYAQATAVATGTAQLTVPLSGLRNIKVPLPDLTTQAQVVAEIESRLSEAEALESVLRQTLTRAGRLRQSVLRRAFRGEL